MSTPTISAPIAAAKGRASMWRYAAAWLSNFPVGWSRMVPILLLGLGIVQSAAPDPDASSTASRSKGRDGRDLRSRRRQAGVTSPLDIGIVTAPGAPPNARAPFTPHAKHIPIFHVTTLYCHQAAGIYWPDRFSAAADRCPPKAFVAGS